MYSMVPTTKPTIVCAAVAARTAPAGNVPAAPPAGGPEVDRATPKSITRPSPSASTMMLAGLRSRCTTPARWAAPSPDATLRAMIITRHRQLALALEDGGQVLALEERHRDVLEAVDLADVVDADDVLVRDLAGEQQLLLEPLLEHAGGQRIGGHFGTDGLQRHRDAELGVPGLVDGAHAARAQQLDDVIALAEVLADEIRGQLAEAAWRLAGASARSGSRSRSRSGSHSGSRPAARRRPRGAPVPAKVASASVGRVDGICVTSGSANVAPRLVTSWASGGNAPRRVTSSAGGGAPRRVASSAGGGTAETSRVVGGGGGGTPRRVTSSVRGAGTPKPVTSLVGDLAGICRRFDGRKPGAGGQLIAGNRRGDPDGGDDSRQEASRRRHTRQSRAPSYAPHLGQVIGSNRVRAFDRYRDPCADIRAQRRENQQKCVQFRHLRAARRRQARRSDCPLDDPRRTGAGWQAHQ